MRRRFLAFPNWEPTLKQFALSPGCEIIEKRDWCYPGLGISRPLLEAFPLGSYHEFKLQHLSLRESCTPPSETPSNYQNDHQIVHFCNGLGRHPTSNRPYMLKTQTQNKWNGTIRTKQTHDLNQTIIVLVPLSQPFRVREAQYVSIGLIEFLKLFLFKATFLYMILRTNNPLNWHSRISIFPRAESSARSA